MRSTVEYIYSNVFLEKRILKIDPDNGNVVKEYDMSYLLSHEQNRNIEVTGDNVLNGIAFNKEDLPDPT